MGATSFSEIAHGRTPMRAFKDAVRKANEVNGLDGYYSPLAEKEEFIRVRVDASKDPYQVVREMFDKDDIRIRDKWGPCGCIDITGSTYAIDDNPKLVDGLNSYLFFGWAAE